MRNWIILFAFAGVLAACQDEAEITPGHSRDQRMNPVFIRNGGEFIARALSVQLKNPDLRHYLKEKILEKFDGDYNFLLALHQKDLINSETAFGDLFRQDFERFSLDEIVKSDPLLQVAMPSLTNLTADNWEPENEIPLVVYRPPDIDLSSTDHLVAFRDGIPELFSLKKESSELVLVISHNERTIVVREGEDPRKELNGLARSECIENVRSEGTFHNLAFFLKESLLQCYYETEPEPPVSEGCERDMYPGMDQVTRAKFTTMNYMREAEHYLDGNPEVYFIVTLASKNPSGFASLRKSFPSNDRSQWKNCGIFSCVPEWHEKNQPVFIWDKEVFGNLVRYDWFEEDFSTGKIDITLGLTSKFENLTVSGNVKITISKKDYFLDQDFVNFCDRANGTGTDYNTGKLYFTINQH
ncbi:hypothetical protein [Fulvivirga sedimenti]|uniref:Uncharacterized protein n=1 Tax=Fulvivirga sedimenti TaxID=2879465 RepID=A0A9X1KZD4_9BACT|nr:hypothetical protein [Fulvivirga sedimenti]MCA6078125.1 hypothetical protein [Fulvivirga sedimenti]